jgi:DNA-binding MarR family transcriptional regulator
MYKTQNKENMMSTDYKNKMLDLPTRKQAGRKPSLTSDQIQEVKSLYDTGDYTLKTLGDHYNVSHTTINKHVK